MSTMVGESGSAADISVAAAMTAATAGGGVAPDEAIFGVRGGPGWRVELWTWEQWWSLPESRRCLLAPDCAPSRDRRSVVRLVWLESAPS